MGVLEGVRSALALILTVLLAACATDRPQETKPHEWHGKSMALAIAPQTLAAGTMGKLLLSGATQGAWDGGQESKGAQLIAENGIENPAIPVAQALFEGARERYGVVAAPTPLFSTSRLSNQTDLAVQAGASDLVLQVASGTLFLAHLTQPGHYEVSSGFTARVVDVHTARTVTEQTCRQSAVGSPTYDELFANRAALLKSTMAHIAQSCSGQLLSTLFPLQP